MCADYLGIFIENKGYHFEEEVEMSILPSGAAIKLVEGRRSTTVNLPAQDTPPTRHLCNV